jgi:hypothetical protein
MLQWYRFRIFVLSLSLPPSLSIRTWNICWSGNSCNCVVPNAQLAGVVTAPALDPASSHDDACMCSPRGYGDGWEACQWGSQFSPRVDMPACLHPKLHAFVPLPIHISDPPLDSLLPTISHVSSHSCFSLTKSSLTMVSTLYIYIYI